MLKKHLDYYLKYLDHDIPAGVVVFLVALPLCLGVAVASNAPPFAGIIAGVVGGLIVSVFSGSQLSVSGPAAGLTVIVATAIDRHGFPGLLLSGAIAGLLQIGMGYARAGLIGAYFPSAVIKGMLAAIGLILITKQLPHTFGYDATQETDLSFVEDDSEATFSFVWGALDNISPGATFVAAISLAILIFWETPRIREHKWLALTPGPLLAVMFGVGYNYLALQLFPSFAIQPQHLVALPQISGPAEFAGQLKLPDFTQLLEPHVYVTAATLALVASLETLLSVEAVDKLDPLKRIAPTNQELKAQGIGNFISSMLGGLPITAVIVRSSANVNAGAHTKVSAIVHGALLLLCVMFLAHYLNMIPLACLAAVLLLTGYKLARPQLVMEQYAKGFNQFAPFAVTIAAILLTDLLKGMAVGMAVGLFFVLKANYHSAVTLTTDGKNYLLRMQKDVSFLNKAPLRSLLASVEDGGYLVIDGARAGFIDQDILETLEDFIKAAGDNNISVEIKNVRGFSAPNGVVTPEVAASLGGAGAH